MTDPLPFLICSFLVSRLPSMTRDRASSLVRTGLQWALASAPLLLCTPFALGLTVCLALWILHFAGWAVERRRNRWTEIRLLTLLAGSAIIFLFSTPGIGGLKLEPVFAGWLHGLTSTLPARFSGMRLFVLLSGLIAATVEANLLVRFILSRLGISPDAKPTVSEPLLPPIDFREFSAGRWIGLLERTLIFYFVFLRHFEAIGVILAAKAFARFKELDQRPFAEYILIGTLLSAILALIAAEAVRIWIGCLGT